MTDFGRVYIPIYPPSLRPWSRERSYPLPIYWYHSKGNRLRYNFATDSFYIMKLCSRLLVLYCRNCPKDDKFRYLIPILRKLGAAQNLGWWLVGKPVYYFLLTVIELLVYLLPLTHYKAKRVKTHCFWRVGQFEPRFQGVIPRDYLLVSRKLDICYLTVQSAPCYVQSFWHNTGVWQSDRQTDGRTELPYFYSACNASIAARCKNWLIFGGAIHSKK